LKIVIKIGGHVFSEGINAQNILSFAEELKRLRSEGHKVIAVAGGGEEARRYIKAGRLLGASEYACDILGIEASRLNARLLIAAMDDLAYPVPPKDIQELLVAFESEKIIVAGGIQPGQSTNAVAAMIAESIYADILINATNVEGVIHQIRTRILQPRSSMRLALENYSVSWAVAKWLQEAMSSSISQQ